MLARVAKVALLGILGVCLLTLGANAETGTIPATEIIRVDAEAFPEVNGAQVVEFEVAKDDYVALSPVPFGGKLMEFTAADGVISGTLFLEAGQYRVSCYMNGPHSDADALYVVVGSTRTRLWSHGFSNQRGEIPWFNVSISEDGLYEVKVECGEVGVQVDALEFEKVS